MTTPGQRSLDLLATVDAEMEAERERERARAIVDQPPVAPDAAAGAIRDGRQLGVDPGIIFSSPQYPEAARSQREWETVQRSPTLQRYLALSEPETASAARDDFTLFADFERSWNEFVAGGRDLGRRYQEQNRRAGQGQRQIAGEIDQAIASAMDPEQRRVALDRARRDAEQFGQDLITPEWWQARGRDIERGADQTWRVIQRGTADLAADFRDQPAVSGRIYEQAQLGWRAIDPAGPGLTPIEQRRLDELSAMQEPMPRTPVGYALQSGMLTLSSLASGAERGYQAGLLGAGTGAISAGLLGQAGPQVALPEEILTVPGGAIAGFGLGVRTGMTVGAAEESARQEAGLAYAEFRQMRDEYGNPLDEQIARNAALIVGAINGGLEVASLRAAVRALPGGEGLLNGFTRDRMRELLTRPTFREALLRAGGRGISVGITEGITETAQELSVIAGAQFAAMADGRDFSGSLGTLQQNWERMMAAGYGGFQAGIVFGGVGATAGLAVDIPRARRADRDQEMITALGDMAEQSALRRRLPERFHAWVDALTANGPMDTIWIDAVAFRTFYQSQGVDPDAVADALPSVGRDALAAAIDARDDIAISLPDYATYIAGTPSQEGLREHTRMHPDADTLAEARHNLANQENVQERIEEAAREADLQGDEQEAQQLIARDMRRRLDLAGVTVSDANQVQAEAIAAAIVESSRKAGENPIETYRRYWADIRGPLEEVEAIPATRTLEQAPAADLDALSADLKGRFGLAELRLTATADGDVVVDEIAVDRKGQRKGNGTAAMRELIKYADRNGIRLRATAPKRGGAYGTTSQARSKAFLEAFGFIENKGKQRDGTISEGMYRPPVGRRRVSQAEVSQTTNRFDPRAVDPAGGTSAPGIPEIGTADFALVLEAAQEKLEAGAPLSYLEAYAINQATAANMPAGGQLSSREYFSREGEDGPNPDNPYDRFGVHRVTPTKKGGVNPELDGTNKRAGPLPPRAPDAEPLTPEQLRQTKLEVNKPVRTVGVGAAGGSAVRKVSLKNIPNVPKEPVAPEAQARLRQLEAERQALEAIIQERMDMELDLPSVEAARKDAAVMRAAAYCTARERIRRVAAVQRVGGAIGGTAATVGGLAIVGNTTEIAPGTPAETPATAPPPPPPAVELPVMDAEEVMAELPAEDAIRADLPEALEEALAESAEVEPPSEAETAAALARRLAYENADPQEPIPLPSEVMQ